MQGQHNSYALLPYRLLTVAKMYLAKHGQFTLSDDCHSIDQIGANYGQLLTFAADTGIQSFQYLNKNPSLNTSFSTISVTELSKHEYFGEFYVSPLVENCDPSFSGRRYIHT